MIYPHARTDNPNMFQDQKNIAQKHLKEAQNSKELT
jgi:hypothetical protein